MRKVTLAALTVASLILGLGAGAADACKVMLLGDDDAEYQVQPALESAGHEVVFLDGYDYGNPLLTYRDDVGDTVVHINHDMTHTTSEINPHSMKALTNSVWFMCLLVSTEESSWSVIKSMY